ncbi:hypothetical protein CLV60_104407 [Dyadobacter jiangsuensis]|uniref:Uncharacterized protein n=1 Tax=Dyadobacter jiangsuensis TaxID=1591085 RepID=A0A2P8G9C2_9BACT|nr:hypothetical protein CLV60_104407 [Dyadobacter jiangsuensis]
MIERNLHKLGSDLLAIELEIIGFLPDCKSDAWLLHAYGI